MIFARRNRLPEIVRVNKAGTVSLLSFIRHMNLPDNVFFNVRIENGGLVLTPASYLNEKQTT